jgi:hypothetical protein
MERITLLYVPSPSQQCALLHCPYILDVAPRDLALEVRVRPEQEILERTRALLVQLYHRLYL